MDNTELIKKVFARLARSYLFWVVSGSIAAALVVSAVVARPEVAVIKMSTLSIDSRDASQMVEMLRYAEETPSIKAVVLEIDSPGGDAVSTEEVYLSVLRLKGQKPVAASVNLWSLSGGYYIAAASNFIYAKPTSMIGSIGVRGSLPEERSALSEDVLASGPEKTVTPTRDAVNWMEMVKQGFISAVVSQRGDRLKLGKEELATASVYIGMEALRYGLIDEIGSSSDAIKKAAELAGVKRYKVVDVNKKLDLLPPWYERFIFQGEIPPGAETFKSPVERLPMFYYRHDIEVGR
ncbi:MAG: S49 family peptidase [Chloroflexi bacterium]|nr:S49 family peptidase [Chloroflexota bacterium]